MEPSSCRELSPLHQTAKRNWCASYVFHVWPKRKWGSTVSLPYLQGQAKHSRTPPIHAFFPTSIPLHTRPAPQTHSEKKTNNTIAKAAHTRNYFSCEKGSRRALFPVRNAMVLIISLRQINSSLGKAKDIRKLFSYLQLVSLVFVRKIWWNIKMMTVNGTKYRRPQCTIASRTTQKESVKEKPKGSGDRLSATTL